MYDFQVSKQLHYDEACRTFAQRHNMPKLAERAVMNVQTLRNKLNFGEFMTMLSVPALQF